MNQIDGVTKRFLEQKEEQKPFEQARAEALAGDALGFKVEWLSNRYDHRLPDAMLHVARMIGQTQDEAWRDHLAWVSDKFIGDPKAMENYAVEQLKEMKLIGIYRKVEPMEPRGNALDALFADDSDLLDG